LQMIELHHNWEGPSNPKSLQTFSVPTLGTKICLVKDHLWVTILSLDGFNIGGLLFEGNTEKSLQSYFSDL